MCLILLSNVNMVMEFHVSMKLIVIALWLFWFTRYEVQTDSVYELKFWDPSSEFEPRRAMAKKETTTNHSIYANSHFQHNRGKLKDRAITEIHGVNHTGSRVAHHNSSHGAHHNEIHTVQHKATRGIKHHKHFYHNSTKDKNGSRKPDLDKWPRASKPKVRRVKPKITPESETQRSTRITPMYLMQKMGEIDETKPSLRQNKKEDDNYALIAYSLGEQMEAIISKFPKVNMTTVVVRRTIEYKDILLFKMTEKTKKTSEYFRAKESKYMDEVPEKNIIFIIHALSVMGIYNLLCLSTGVYFTKLLSFYLAHLDKFDIFLMPMANPDGFHAFVQMWNKNQSPQKTCSGVAVDRNFDVAWNASHNIHSCTQQYPGPAPFSEPESQAIREVFHNYSHKIIAYLNVHSGTFDLDTFKGDAVLYPRGYTEMQSDDDKYIDLKGEIDEAMKNASFQVVSVTVDTLHNWYGKVFGTSVDYASTVYGVPYAMELVMQLYDQSSNGKMEDGYDYLALTEIWGRVINVIFNNIYRNTRVNDVI